MSQNGSPARIISAFSNPRSDQPGYLAWLEEEKLYLEKLLRAMDRDDKLRHLSLTDVRDPEMIKQMITDYRAKVRVFHYSGHATTRLLDLQGQIFSADNLALYIQLCPSIRLVFLNGCSTWGFIRKIFGILVEYDLPRPVIIATSADVNDRDAMEFAKKFYELLVNGNVPVREAFRIALMENQRRYVPADGNIFQLDVSNGEISGVTVQPVKASDGQTRASRPRFDQLTGPPDEPATWGLYFIQGTPLNWQLMEKEEAPGDIIVSAKKKIDAARAGLEELKPKIDLKQEDINYLPAGAPPRERAEKELAAFLEEKRKFTDSIGDLQDELRLARENEQDEKIIRTFGSRFYKLNYLQQKDFFEIKVSLQDKFLGFILQGTVDCGINVLSRRVAEFLKLENTHVIAFNATDQIQKPVWQKICDDLEMYDIDPDPDAVVKEMQQQYRNDEGETQKGYLFVFSNPPGEPAFQEFTMKALKFWKQFTELFQKLDPTPEADHRICLFILDGYCERVAGEPECSSNHTPVYEQLIRDMGEAAPIVVPPVVHPLKPETIRKWQYDDNQFTQNMVLQPLERQTVVDKTRGNLVPAIRMISQLKVRSSLKKDYAYREFEKNYLNQSLAGIFHFYENL